MNKQLKKQIRKQQYRESLKAEYKTYNWTEQAMIAFKRNPPEIHVSKYQRKKYLDRML